VRREGGEGSWFSLSFEPSLERNGVVVRIGRAKESVRSFVMVMETRGHKRQRREGKDAVDVLPKNAWLIVAEKLDHYDRCAFGLTCWTLFDAVTTADAEREKSEPLLCGEGLNPTYLKEGDRPPLRLDLRRAKLLQQSPRFTFGWYKWVYHSLKRRKGAPTQRRRGQYLDDLYDSDLMHLASFQGKTNVLRWLKSQGMPLDHRYCMAGGGGGGHIEVLELLKREGCKFHEEASVAAARAGHTHVLEWLRENGCELGERTCSYAGLGGHIEVLEYLKAKGCALRGATCRSAARGGHLDALKWLQGQGLTFSARVVSSAASGGHLDVVKWLVAGGCQWRWNGRFIIAKAAEGGHLHVIKWLRSQGCDWDERVCLYATRGVRLNTLQWLLGQDPPAPWNKEDCQQVISRILSCGVDALCWMSSQQDD